MFWNTSEHVLLSVYADGVPEELKGPFDENVLICDRRRAGHRKVTLTESIKPEMRLKRVLIMSCAIKRKYRRKKLHLITFLLFGLSYTYEST